MRNEQLESLIRRVLELDELAGDPRPAAMPRRIFARIGPRMVGVAAAAGLALAALLPFQFGRDYQPPPITQASAVPVPVTATLATAIDYEPVHRLDNDARIDTFHTCASEDTFALVLFRAWDESCQCVVWKLHQFADGSARTHLTAGETLAIPLDVSNTPPVEQVVVFAVAQSVDELPETAGEAEDLLACLNETLPPSAMGDQPKCCTAPVESCLPPGVALVERSFVVE